MFADLRTKLAILFDFAQVTDPITTGVGLRGYLEWCVRAAEAFAVPMITAAGLQRVLGDKAAFEQFHAVVCFAHSMKDETIETDAQGGFLVHTTCGQRLYVTWNTVNDMLLLASQLITFVNDINRMANR